MKTRKRLVKPGEGKLSLEELHRRLWNWVGYKHGNSKSTWPCWERNGGVVPRTIGDCFACQHAYTRPRTDTGCGHTCPIKWAGERCNEGDGEYGDYCRASLWADIEDQQRLAKVIAKLAWRGKPVYVKLLK